MRTIKRVCFLTHTQELYGANRSMLALIDGLREHGVEACVVMPENGRLGEVLTERAVPWTRIPFAWRAEPAPAEPRSLYRYLVQRIRRDRLNRGAVDCVVQWAREQGVDLVHSNSVVVDIGVPVSKRLGLPHVWHLREFGDLDFELKFNGGLRRARAGLASAACVIAVSKKVSEHLCTNVPKDRVRVIYNGIAQRSVIEERGRLPRSRAPRKLLMVGYVQKNKGQNLALEALAQLKGTYPDLTATFVGGGELDWLQSESRRLGVEKSVTAVGYAKDPNPYYRDADIALICSQAEAFGRVTAEAASHRLAIVGMNAGATPELIQHGQTGLLFDRTGANLAGNIRQILENPSLAEQLGRRAWEYAATEFSTEAYVSKVWKAYRELPGSS